MLISVYYGSIAAGFAVLARASPGPTTFWSDRRGWTDG